MPNPERAVVDIEKLRDYCLNPEHPRGRHKARVFAAALGLTARDAEELSIALLEAVRTGEAFPTTKDEYGERYFLDFTMSRPYGQARIRSLWIIPRGEDFPRLSSCYVL